MLFRSFLKLYGMRIGLDECEQIIKGKCPIECACVGTDVYKRQVVAYLKLLKSFFNKDICSVLLSCMILYFFLHSMKIAMVDVYKRQTLMATLLLMNCLVAILML